MIPMIHTYRTPEISWPKNRIKTINPAIQIKRRKS